MRILAVSDIESPYYYDHYTPGKLKEFDLILACGDLEPAYLEFLLSLGRCPVLYVRGNHDDGYGTKAPEGCICVEDKIYVHEGVRILGLGGSFRYRDGDNMFTEAQMQARVRRMSFQLWKHKGFDILMTHAPARHINDMDALPHRGFDCFVSLLDRYQPRYFIHGHIHRTYGHNIPQRTVRGGTVIINAYEHYLFDY
jgi:Icc-related predicted phosphoesterase